MADPKVKRIKRELSALMTAAEHENDPPPTPYDLLPFVDDNDGNGRIFWRIKPTGDYCLDRAIGEDMGRRAVAFARKHPSQVSSPGWLFGVVAREMVDRGCRDMALGFFEVVGEAAIGRSGQ